MGYTITAIKGFKDILPDEAAKWQFVEKRARYFLENFGFREIRPPILEKTELFQRGIGASTDVVEKEIYTLLDRNAENISLRPEATAGVVRSYIENALFNQEAVAKLYTIGAMFRRERPQKGRYRQFHQINAEVLGVAEPLIDAEIMLMLRGLLADLGLNSLLLEINSLGCPDCNPPFREKLVAFLGTLKGSLCADCQRRSAVNPLRVFDCKVESCQEALRDAPLITNYLCEECLTHWEMLQKYLRSLNLNYAINPKMVRGLDYYTRTAFEITTTQLGAQNALCGGGRYNGLVKQLGGPDIPGIGFAIGFERLVSLLPATNAFQKTPALFIAALGNAVHEKTFVLLNTLRLSGICCETEYGSKSLKAMMKRADKLGARFVMFLGDKELAENTAIIRNMHSGEQTPFALAEIEKIVAFIGREVK